MQDLRFDCPHIKLLYRGEEAVVWCNTEVEVHARCPGLELRESCTVKEPEPIISMRFCARVEDESHCAECIILPL
jgi:hypothetical protein